jgi:hypothetical protein
LLETVVFSPDLVFLPGLFAVEEDFAVAAGFFLCAEVVVWVCISPVAAPQATGTATANRAPATITIRTLPQTLNIVSFFSQPTLPL